MPINEMQKIVLVAQINIRQSELDLTHTDEPRTVGVTSRRTATGNWLLGYQSLRLACLANRER